MKWLERSLLGIIVAGILMAPQTSQVNSYVNGNVLTADQLNSEFGNIYSTINGLDEDNFLSTTSILPKYITSTIAGTAITRDPSTGVLAVGVDDVGIETSGDTIRLKALGVVEAKLGNSSVTSSKIVDETIVSADIFDGTIVDADISDSAIFGIGDGAAATPAYAFSSDPDTGMYRAGANTIGWAVGGSNVVSLSSAAFVINSPFLSVPDGTAGGPSVQFNADPDTGIYRVGTNQLGFATGGSVRATISSSGLSTDGGSTFIKSKVFTETALADGTYSESITGTVIGAVGFYSGIDVGGGHGFSGVMSNVDPGTSPSAWFVETDGGVGVIDTDSVSFTVNSDVGGENVKIVVYYQ